MTRPDENVRIFDGLGNTHDDGGLTVKFLDMLILVDSGQIFVFHITPPGDAKPKTLKWGPEPATGENLNKAFCFIRQDRDIFRDLPANLQRQAG